MSEHATSARPDPPASLDVDQVFREVWRLDFAAPGFALLDLGRDVDSCTLRHWMLLLKHRLSEFNMSRTGKPFLVRSMGRFDQQVATKFHIDGAPPESLLMLGYESSKVRARLFIADYSRCAYHLGLTPQQFLLERNPMYSQNEELLVNHVTELAQDQASTRILLINNSSLPFTEARLHPLGVMHRAIIDAPSETERRLVNSMMLVTEGDELSTAKQAEFVETAQIARKIEYPG